MKTLKEAIKNNYLKETIPQEKEVIFSRNLEKMLSSIKNSDNANKREEELKTHFQNFLLHTFYSDNFIIAPIDDIDLVIKRNSLTSSKPLVIFEVKKPSSNEMITTDDFNKKALAEAILYYLRERIDNDNRELKHIIITDVYQFFIFDASLFETLFFNNKALLKEFRTSFSKKSSENGKIKQEKTQKTVVFYNEVAPKYISAIEEKLKEKVTYFDIREYSKEKNALTKQAYYKILSPTHLLKEEFLNDSNTLDTGFYKELLYILGLEEVVNKGIYTIERVSEKERQPASILENVTQIIEEKNRTGAIDKKFESEAELFEITLELSLMWINRILFLKLLEGSLINYNRDKSDIAFLNNEKIKNFQELKELFFEVLALKFNDRRQEVKDKFMNIPYLNSSLFEYTEFERNYCTIDALKIRLELPLFKETVLKDSTGKSRTGKLSTLEYIFEFLNSYDFSSQEGDMYKGSNKTIINAAVLGLLFERINGYKDGSVYTPSFISMYMCQESIDRTVINSFNRDLSWNCLSIIDVHNSIIQHKIPLQKANDVFNNIRICDPSVGSGHFLVSALNRLIYLKFKLNILIDNDGYILSNLDITLKNDELVILYHNTPYNYDKTDVNSRKIQEAIFNNKRLIIENSLFGVDINNKSVLICRLRLWIELLKQTYYTKESGYTELETLPNIDINIKFGNSLVSLFALSSKYQKGNIQKIRLATQKYKEQILIYKNSDVKDVKRRAEEAMREIKESFKVWNTPRNKDYIQLCNKERELNDLTSSISFDVSELDKKESEARLTKIANEYDKLKTSYEQKIRDIYSNAFEWRFEFPEVLDDDGNFIGFDLVIGNPPYIMEYANKEAFKGLHELPCYQGKTDIWHLFTCRATEIVRESGFINFIAKNQWITSSSAEKMREVMYEKTEIINIIDFGANLVFMPSASPQTMIFLLQENKTNLSHNIQYCRFENEMSNGELENILLGEDISPKIASDYLDTEADDFDNNNRINVKVIVKNIPKTFPSTENLNFNNDAINSIIEKIESFRNFTIDEKKEIIQGIIGGPDEAFIVDKKAVSSFNKEEQKYLKNFHTHTDRYVTPDSDKYILYLSKKNFNKNNLDESPNIYTKLLPFKEELNNRRETLKGSKEWFHLWWERNEDFFKASLEGYPNIENHFALNREILVEKKVQYKTPDKRYYYLHRERDESFFKKGEKLIFAKRTEGRKFTYTTKAFYGTANLFFIKSDRVNLKYLTGLLNSRLFYFYMNNSLKHTGDLLQLDKNQFLKIPLYISKEKEQNKVIKLVDLIISKKESSISTEIEEEKLDNLIFSLYELIPKEIEIVLKNS